ncbi:MAG: acyltransferase [Burkholderiales bacterium]|nr:acyltransferase [Burkholderiales bacterium]
MGTLSPAQVAELGFISVGNNVRLSDKASIYGANRIRIGNNVRIDDFCVLSAGEGGIDIGDNVHIAVFSTLIGHGEIVLEPFAGLSSRVTIYSSSDDYSGEHLTNPTIPEEYLAVHTSPVRISRHVIVGAGAVILPGVTLKTGAAIGALSVVIRDCDEFTIYAGVPVRRIGERKRDLLELERKFLAAQSEAATHG